MQLLVVDLAMAFLRFLKQLPLPEGLAQVRDLISNLVGILVLLLHFFVGLFKEAWSTLLSQRRRFLPNLNLVAGMIKTKLSHGVVDDREYLVEHIIQFAASLPNGSKFRAWLNAQFIGSLWNALQHPPISYLGDEFQYRTADGSKNNTTNLQGNLGAAGSHYAQSVVPKRPRSLQLPDPSVIFDTLLARNGPFKEHPTKVSSMLFHFATIIIHDLFHTDVNDNTKLKNSSYLDLSPLYGKDQTEQDYVREHKDGLLKKDVFAELRLLFQPPGVCVLIIAFNRFHNYVVRELARRNEHSRFTLPRRVAKGDNDEENEKEEKRYTDALSKRDENLFQTGRLITCGLYANIILGDYLRTILNLNRNPVQSDWKLDPREDFHLPRVFDREGIPRGTGNQVSAEFNMLYRWHSAISARDEEWLTKLIIAKFGRDALERDISVQEYTDKIRNLIGNQPGKKPANELEKKLNELEKELNELEKKPNEPEKKPYGPDKKPNEPEKKYNGTEKNDPASDPAKDPTKDPRNPRNFPVPGLKRNPEDESFADADLVNILRDSTESVAGAFGARHVPRALKVIEKLGIEQGRKWGLATLNEFRQFLKLQPYSSFEEVNPDPCVCEALQKLYGHPDNIELYPGLLVEAAKKPMVPGSGLCPGFTTSFAILSDAVALVRGDRFYTVDFNPVTMTDFGFKEASPTFDIAGGGVMYKLLNRAFPGWYRDNSIYALYPFTTPDGNREAFLKLRKIQEFDFEKPAFTKLGKIPEVEFEKPAVKPLEPLASWQRGIPAGVNGL